MSDARHPPRRRDAFTLIELIVVMALILAVAAVGIGYAVYGQDNNHSAAAAAMVQGAALNARSRAHLDGKPTGVRILFINNQATQLLLIQQPEDYNLGQVSQTAPAGSTQVNFSGVDFQGGADYAGQSNQTTESTVEAGDYFVVIDVLWNVTFDSGAVLHQPELGCATIWTVDVWPLPSPAVYLETSLALRSPCAVTPVTVRTFDVVDV
jgi:prepilin-type N-terminal cleavage/methylation domain-containing protein